MTKYELYFQLARSYAVEQETRKSQLEIKGSASLGLSAALIGFAGLAGWNGDEWSGWLLLPVILMGFAFLLSAAHALRVLQVQDFQTSPPLATLYEQLPNYEEDSLMS